MTRKVSVAIVCIGFVILGATAGGIIAPRLGSSGMGWDDIGDVFGGLAAGAVAGLALALLSVRLLPDRALRGAAITVGVTALLLIGSGVYRYQSAMKAARQQSEREAARLDRARPTSPAQPPP